VRKSNAIKSLEKLAKILVDNKAATKPQRTCVVPFVGAGASRSAGLPISRELKAVIHDRLISGNETVQKIVELEIEKRFNGSKAAAQLTLFEYASALSNLVYAKNVISSTIREAIGAATHRPLAYELLAHLAKHNYLDFFVSLNFDVLLDDAVREEIPSAKIISTPDDVPGPYRGDDEDDPHCVFKPFGCLSTGKFKLTEEEVNVYGPESVWEYLQQKICNYDKVLIILVGYAAHEKAFSVLLEKLASQNLDVSLCVIDPKWVHLPRSSQLREVTHIKAKADDALSILLDIIGMSSRHMSALVSRHKIISKFVPYRLLNDPDVRFQLEVLFQAIKSRGFFTVNAVTKIKRIQGFNRHAKKNLEQLASAGILKVKLTYENYYVAADYHRIATYILGLLEMEQAHLDVWEVEQSGEEISVRKKKTASSEYLVRELQNLAAGVEIEIFEEGLPETRWLFNEPHPLRTLEELGSRTRAMLREFLSSPDSHVEMFGIWSTGAWIFNEPKYISMLRKKLENGTLSLKVILSDREYEQQGANKVYMRPVQEEINNLISNPAMLQRFEGRLEIYKMNWWRLNRIMTLVVDRDRQLSEGIYMRRRLATPLVSPVHVDEEDDCEVLKQIFDRYLSEKINPDNITRWV